MYWFKIIKASKCIMLIGTYSRALIPVYDINRKFNAARGIFFCWVSSVRWAGRLLILIFVIYVESFIVKEYSFFLSRYHEDNWLSSRLETCLL